MWCVCGVVCGFIIVYIHTMQVAQHKGVGKCRLSVHCTCTHAHILITIQSSHIGDPTARYKTLLSSKFCRSKMRPFSETLMHINS